MKSQISNGLPCIICNKVFISKQSLTRHLQSERKKYQKVASTLEIIEEQLDKLSYRHKAIDQMSKCSFCGKEYANKYVVRAHESRCINNPNNQYVIEGVVSEKLQNHHSAGNLGQLSFQKYPTSLTWQDGGSEEEQLSGDEGGYELQKIKEKKNAIVPTIRDLDDATCLKESIEALDSFADVVAPLALHPGALKPTSTPSGQKKEKTGVIARGVVPIEDIELKYEPGTAVNYNKVKILMSEDYLPILTEKLGNKAMAYSYLKNCLYRKVEGDLDIFNKIYLEGRPPSRFPIKCLDAKNLRFAYIDEDGDLIENTNFTLKHMSGNIQDCYIQIQNEIIFGNIDKGEPGYKVIFQYHDIREWQGHLVEYMDARYQIRLLRGLAALLLQKIDEYKDTCLEYFNENGPPTTPMTPIS